MAVSEAQRRQRQQAAKRPRQRRLVPVVPSVQAEPEPSAPSLHSTPAPSVDVERFIPDYVTGDDRRRVMHALMSGLLPVDLNGLKALEQVYGTMHQNRENHIALKERMGRLVDRKEIDRAALDVRRFIVEHLERVPVTVAEAFPDVPRQTLIDVTERAIDAALDAAVAAAKAGHVDS